MSTLDDVESESLSNDAATPQPATLISPMTRRLQTFGLPDLEVAVGSTERLYRYHSLILASHSLYVDTLLSSPAATREQERRLISFPDIEVEIWEKMMKYLTPVTERPSPADLCDIIPLYDKYQFLDAMRYCDVILSEYIGPEREHYSYINNETYKSLVHLVSLTHKLNFFPISKPLAQKWAARRLNMFLTFDEESIVLLTPVVENDDAIIKSMAWTFLGKKCRGMSLTDMRDIIKDPGFPQKCISRCKEIVEIDKQVAHLIVKQLDVTTYGQFKNMAGRYKCGQSETSIQPQANHVINCFETSNSKHFESHCGGAASRFWTKTYNNHNHREDKTPFILVAKDVYGSIWEIYTYVHDDNSDDDEENDEPKERVIFRWENGAYNSLVPPAFGWKSVDESGNETDLSDEEFSISYSIGSI